jgi:hypothetical protein
MKRKNTWAKAIAAEERFKKENAVSNDDMLLSTHIKGVNPLAHLEISRKFKRKLH